jgi:hypothetical protein
MISTSSGPVAVHLNADPPPAVDADAVGVGAIATNLLEPIAGLHPKITERVRGVKDQEFRNAARCGPWSSVRTGCRCQPRSASLFPNDFNTPIEDNAMRYERRAPWEGAGGAMPFLTNL